MTTANSDNTTYRTPLRSYVIEAAAIVFILVAGGVTSCLIASNLEIRAKALAAHCASRAPQ